MKSRTTTRRLVSSDGPVPKDQALADLVLDDAIHEIRSYEFDSLGEDPVT